MRILAALCCSLALLLCALEARAEVAYIQADVLKLRAAPRTGAPVVARLRIGTEVRLLSAPDERFREVSLDDDPEVRGFVDARFLADAPIAKASALSKAGEARERGALQEAVRWVERAAALDGDPDTLRLLSSLYAAKGDRAHKARVDDVLKGRTPAYLAACRGGRVLLLARHDPERGLVALADELEPEEDLDALAPLLSGALWFTFDDDDDGPRPLPGTPFPHPEVTVVYNAGHPTLPGGGFALVLGKCAKEGALYSTARIEPVDGKRLRTKSAKRARRHLSRALAASLADPSVDSVPLEQERVIVIDALARTRGADVRVARVVSVHDARGRLALTVGGPRARHTRPAGDLTWIALPSGTAVGVLPIEREGAYERGEGYALLLVDEGGPVRMDVMVALSSAEGS